MKSTRNARLEQRAQRVAQHRAQPPTRRPSGSGGGRAAPRRAASRTAYSAWSCPPAPVRPRASGSGRASRAARTGRPAGGSRGCCRCRRSCARRARAAPRRRAPPCGSQRGAAGAMRRNVATSSSISVPSSSIASRPCTIASSSALCAAGHGRARGGRRPARDADPALQHGLERLGRDRLRDVVVHAGLEALLAVALHRARGHRDDRRAPRRPPRARGCAASPRSRPCPASARPSARRRTAARSQASSASLAVVGHLDAVAELLEDAHRDLLVHLVVLGDQHRRGARLGAPRAGCGA